MEEVYSGFGLAVVLLSHLVLLQNKASHGGNFAAEISGKDPVPFSVSNCIVTRGYADLFGGGMYFTFNNAQPTISLQNMELVENVNKVSSENFLSISKCQGSFSLLNSSVLHTETFLLFGVFISGCCMTVRFINTKIHLSKQNESGCFISSDSCNRYSSMQLTITNSVFEKSQLKVAILHLLDSINFINNFTFTSNSAW